MAEQEGRRNTARFLVPLLSLALVASLVWGYTEYRSRRSWEIRTENLYNKSFSELTTHVGELETELSKSLVSNSPKKLMENFTSIWRQAYQSQEDLGQLPLASVELSRTKNFLAKVAAFSFNMASHTLKGNVLSEKQWQTLSDLHRQARYLMGQLTNLQERMLEGEERWLNVDRIDMASMVADVSERLNTNKITKSFMMLEDGFKRLPDPDFEGNLLNFKPKAKGFTGPEINVEQAREKAIQFLDRDGKRYRAKYEGQIKGDYPVYMFQLNEDTDEGKNLPSARVGVSVKGGHPVWMLKDRLVSESGLSLEEAGKRAQTFLAKRGYPEMKPVAIEEFRNVATVNLVSNLRGTLVYPELIKTQVALDNGEVLGVETIPYLTFHDPNRSIPQPKLSEKEVRKKLNPHLKVERIQKAIILNDQFKEVLSYESEGTLGEDRFLVYINALTGDEEKIKRIDRYGAEKE